MTTIYTHIKNLAIAFLLAMIPQVASAQFVFAGATPDEEGHLQSAMITQGSALYNKVTHTLTLEDVYVKTSVSAVMNVLFVTDELNIDLKGTNFFDYGDKCIGIYLAPGARLTLSGEGMLQLGGWKFGMMLSKGSRCRIAGTTFYSNSAIEGESADCGSLEVSDASVSVYAPVRKLHAVSLDRCYIVGNEGHFVNYADEGAFIGTDQLAVANDVEIAPSAHHLFVMGNNKQWNAAAQGGVLDESEVAGVFRGCIPFAKIGDTSYLSITTTLGKHASDWSTVNAHRLGAISYEGDKMPFNHPRMMYASQVPWQIMGEGMYEVVVDTVKHTIQVNNPNDQPDRLYVYGTDGNYDYTQPSAVLHRVNGSSVYQGTFSAVSCLYNVSATFAPDYDHQELVEHYLLKNKAMENEKNGEITMIVDLEKKSIKIQ